MSWAAHQFEIYAVQAHLPKKMRGKISFFAIFFGDFTPDFFAKFWVYGITIGGTHYGATTPHLWHRGWPGMGFTHTLAFGLVGTVAIWLWRHNRAWTIGYLLGFTAHALTDINDSIGTMLVFPFSTLNWSVGTWAYAATIEGGKYLDAAAYYSSLGFVMDAFWLVVVLCSWRVLTREYWRTQVVPGDPHAWAWLGRFFDERGLLAIYRGVFFYGVCRLIAWTTWAHLLVDPVIDGVRRSGYPWDLSWGGPWWIPARELPSVSPWIVLPVTLALLALVYGSANRLWDKMAPSPRRSPEPA
ncbi:MAG TPA: metal-dependent hydrolase [Acidimicrobiia bacterium]|nr:metal-dependent hydrolase [Acidimicrobiia bacterium]